MPQQLHLEIASARECFRLANDVFNRTTTLAAACERHDAKCAEIIAPFHDRDVGLDARNSFDLLGGDIEIFLVPSNLDDFLFRAEDRRQDFW